MGGFNPESYFSQHLATGFWATNYIHASKPNRKRKFLFKKMWKYCLSTYNTIPFLKCFDIFNNINIITAAWAYWISLYFITWYPISPLFPAGLSLLISTLIFSVSVNIVIGLLFVSDKQPLVLLLLFHFCLSSINKSTKNIKNLVEV